MIALSALRPPLRVLAPINEVKEVPIHIYDLVLSTVNMANSAYPDETPRFAASHLGLRYL